MTDTPPRAPNGLGRRANRFWRSTLEEFDFTRYPDKLLLLERACKVIDRVEQLEIASAAADLIVNGSTGQPVINPMIAEARQQQQLLTTLLRALSLPETDDVVEAHQAQVSDARKGAARKARFDVHA